MTAVDKRAGGLLTFCALLIVGTRLEAAPPMVFPGAAWQTASPESQGVDSEKLTAAIEYLTTNAGSDGVRELVVVRNGYLIWQGDRVDAVHGVWSCTKSFTSTVLGLLIEDGRCTLESRAADFVPALQAAYPDVTLRHLTTMTSGYRAVGDEPKGGYLHGPSGTPFQPGDVPLFPPGSQYAYWDSAMNLFGLVLTHVAGESLEAVFKRRIADPIGMDPQRWDWGDYTRVSAVDVGSRQQPSAGASRRAAPPPGTVVNGGSGNANRHITISAKELARFGHLLLNEGRWDGQQLIDRRWIESATSVQVPPDLPWAQPDSGIDGRGVYGFNWWVNGIKPDERRLWPAAPPDTFAASGHNNNKMFVIPAWKMVIVRLGLDQRDRKIDDEAWNEFLRRIEGALQVAP